MNVALFTSPEVVGRLSSSIAAGSTLEASGELGGALAAVGEQLMAGASLAEAFPRAMRSLDPALKVRRAALFVADAKQRTLSVSSVFGASVDDFRPRYGLGVAGRVAEGGRPLVVPAVRREPMALSELADPIEWQDERLSLVSVPLLLAKTVRRRPIGLLRVRRGRRVHCAGHLACGARADDRKALVEHAIP